jgi:hypothetical protein
MTSISIGRFKRKHCLSAMLVALVALIAIASSSTAATTGKGIQPTNAVFDGTNITPDQAADRGLTCIQKADGALSCFSSKAEALKSPVARSEAKAIGESSPTSDGTASVSKKRGKKGKAAYFGGAGETYMEIARDTDFYTGSGGWDILGYAEGNWYDMSGGYANSGSSASSGNHSGYLADNYGGGTPRLRFEVGDFYGCLCYASWNDRAQSRYRN